MMMSGAMIKRRKLSDVGTERVQTNHPMFGDQKHETLGSFFQNGKQNSEPVVATSRSCMSFVNADLQAPATIPEKERRKERKVGSKAGGGWK